MIKLKTDCDNCIHVKVCKNKNNARIFMERLSDLAMGCIQHNDNISVKAAADYYNASIDIYCPDFESKICYRESTLGWQDDHDYRLCGGEEK